MEILTIFNTVISIGLLLFLIWKYFIRKFHFEVSKTFWYKIPYSVTLWYTYKESKYGSTSKGIFTIPLRNYLKVQELDSKKFNARK